MSGPIRAYLVANARYHDTDFARLELLKLLAEDPEVRTRVADSFSAVDAIAKSDFLVTYTCDLRPSEREAEALRDFVASGGRWLVLHGTNAILEIGPKGMDCSREHVTFMETLGSRFVAHPPLEPYTVTVSDPEHPLVRGIEPFEVPDELYLCEYYGEVKPLLETRFTGTFQSRTGPGRRTEVRGIRVFRGIPFARPPIGARRFQGPEAPEPWTGTLEAVRPGAVAIQAGLPMASFLNAGGANQSEGCLHLNVWTPGTDSSRRPVLVWIHGGGFLIGAGSTRIYDGHSLAQRGNLVVITFNYRLVHSASCISTGSAARSSRALRTRACAIRSPCSNGSARTSIASAATPTTSRCADSRRAR